jgi:Cu/Ag efflux protein CusF
MLDATLLFVILALPQSIAQIHDPKPVAQTEITTMDATVIAIDHDKRIATLRDAKGDEITINVPEAVTRFSSVRVGDTVKAKYRKAVIYAWKTDLAKAPRDQQSVNRHEGEQPSGTLSRSTESDVTVLAVDTEAPSITVKTDDERTLVLQVEDAARLKNVKVGQVIRITYVESITMAVEPAD